MDSQSPETPRTTGPVTQLVTPQSMIASPAFTDTPRSMTASPSFNLTPGSAARFSYMLTPNTPSKHSLASNSSPTFTPVPKCNLNNALSPSTPSKVITPRVDTVVTTATKTATTATAITTPGVSTPNTPSKSRAPIKSIPPIDPAKLQDLLTRASTIQASNLSCLQFVDIVSQLHNNVFRRTLPPLATNRYPSSLSLSSSPTSFPQGRLGSQADGERSPSQCQSPGEPAAKVVPGRAVIYDKLTLLPLLFHNGHVLLVVYKEGRGPRGWRVPSSTWNANAPTPAFAADAGGNVGDNTAIGGTIAGREPSDGSTSQSGNIRPGRYTPSIDQLCRARLSSILQLPTATLIPNLASPIHRPYFSSRRRPGTRNVDSWILAQVYDYWAPIPDVFGGQPAPTPRLGPECAMLRVRWFSEDTVRASKGIDEVTRSLLLEAFWRVKEVERRVDEAMRDL